MQIVRCKPVDRLIVRLIVRLWRHGQVDRALVDSLKLGLSLAGQVNRASPIAPCSSAMRRGGAPKSIESESVRVVRGVQVDRRRSRGVARTPKSIEVGPSGSVPTRSGAPKIDSKSASGPSRNTPWRPRAFGERLGSVSWRPRHAPGRPERPQRRHGTPNGAPRSGRECAEVTKIDARSRPGTTNASFLRAARS